MNLDLLHAASSLLGIEESSLLALVIFISSAANLIARWIPNDATGWQATVRKVASVIGMYLPSRVTAGTTVADAARIVLEQRTQLGDPDRPGPLTAQWEEPDMPEPEPLVIPPEFQRYLQSQLPPQDGIGESDFDDAR